MLVIRSASFVRRASVLPARVHVHGGGVVRLGARVVFDTAMAPIELHVAPGAEIVLADDVWIGAGTSIEARNLVRVGARARIGAFSKILDCHFHALEGDRHGRPKASEVIVEEDVTIGPRCVLLPRAHVGRGSTLGAGTVASRRFRPNVRIAGVPATVREVAP